MLGWDAFRDRSNAVIVDELPRFPGAQEIDRATSPDRVRQTMPAARGTLVVEYRVPAGTSEAALLAFYRAENEIREVDIPVAVAYPPSTTPATPTPAPPKFS